MKKVVLQDVFNSLGFLFINKLQFQKKKNIPISVVNPKELQAQMLHFI